MGESNIEKNLLFYLLELLMISAKLFSILLLPVFCPDIKYGMKLS